MSIIDCSSILEKMISFGGISGKERLLNLPCLNGSAALHFLGCNLVMSNHYNKARLLFLPELRLLYREQSWGLGLAAYLDFDHFSTLPLTPL